MNKSFATNLISFLVLISGYFIPEYGDVFIAIGAFSFSGAITNWLAIYMLFEKVPFLYGSGVITKNFHSFRIEIKRIIMEEFFTLENINNFLKTDSSSFNKEDIMKSIDFDKVFKDLVEAIKTSSIGGMLDMVGGEEVLEPLKEPFTEKLQITIAEVYDNIKENKSLQISETLLLNIENIVDSRLQDLTAEKVKQIIHDMIRKHLGWLVVWGGLFGGLIGMAVCLFEKL